MKEEWNPYLYAAHAACYVDGDEGDTHMKTLGINSVVDILGRENTVTKITSKGVTLTGEKGKQSLTFPLKDVEAAIKAGRWKVKKSELSS